MIERVDLSIVTPVYLAEGNIDELVARIIESIQDSVGTFEIVLVDDGSPDRSWSTIERACARDNRVKGLRLSRNFGQHIAIAAGLDRALGEQVVVMDCDLQENPRYIPEMLARAKEGYDIVYTSRRNRSHSRKRKWGAKLYHTIYNWLTDSAPGQENSGTYTLLSRKVVDSYCRFRDVQRHHLLVLQWLGFSSSTLEIAHEARKKGSSSYTYTRLVRHAIDGVVSQSTKLLYLSVVLGLSMSFLSFAGCVLLVLLYFLHGFKEGWASLAVLILMCTGYVLLAVGVASLYLGKMFEQVKERPLYVVADALNFDRPSLRSRFKEHIHVRQMS